MAPHSTNLFSSWSRKHKKVHKMVLVDYKLKSCEIADTLKISEGSVFTICMNIWAWESSVQNGYHVCSKSIKNNNASTIEMLEKRWNKCITLEGDYVDEWRIILFKSCCFISHPMNLLCDMLHNTGLQIMGLYLLLENERSFPG